LPRSFYTSRAKLQIKIKKKFNLNIRNIDFLFPIFEDFFRKKFSLKNLKEPTKEMHKSFSLYSLEELGSLISVS